MPSSLQYYPDSLYYYLLSSAFVLPAVFFSIWNGRDEELEKSPLLAHSEDSALYMIDSLLSLVDLAEINEGSKLFLNEVLLKHKAYASESVNPILLLNIRHISNEDLQASTKKILNQYFLYLFSRLLDSQKNPPRLRLTFSIFLSSRLQYHNQSLQLLHQTSMADCSIVDVYMIDKARSMVETLASKSMASMTDDIGKSVAAINRASTVFDGILSVSVKMEKFWRNVRAAKSDLDVTKDVSYEVMNDIERLRNEMKKPLYQGFPSLLLAYFKFERSVLNNQLMNDKVMRVIMKKTKSLLDSAYSFENIEQDIDLSQTDQGYAVLECHEEKKFEITNCNKSFARLINYQKDELLGTDFMVHFPKQMQHAARDFLCLKEGFKEQVFILQMRHGYIREFHLSAKHMNDEYDRDILMVRLSQKPQSYNSYLFLADKSGVLAAYSTSTIFLTRLHRFTY